MLESKTEEITYLKFLSRDKEFAIGKNLHRQKFAIPNKNKIEG